MAYPKLVQGLRDGELDVAAGTAWMWAREDFAASVDTLVIDEAGQMSLANVLAVCRRRRATSCSWAIRNSSLNQARPRIRLGLGCRRWSTCSGAARRCPTTRACSSTRRTGCIPALCRYSSEVFYDGRLRGHRGP